MVISLYPASLRPVDTIESTASVNIVWLIAHSNLAQSLNPIGGVGDSNAADTLADANRDTVELMMVCKCIGHWHGRFALASLDKFICNAISKHKIGFLPYPTSHIHIFVALFGKVCKLYNYFSQPSIRQGLTFKTQYLQLLTSKNFRNWSLFLYSVTLTLTRDALVLLWIVRA